MGKTAATGIELATDVYSGTLGSATQSASFTIYGTFNFAIYGTFSATAQLEKSFDGGTNWVPVKPAMVAIITASNAPFVTTVMEPEKGVIYRVNCTAYTSGTISWRASATSNGKLY